MNQQLAIIVKIYIARSLEEKVSLIDYLSSHPNHQVNLIHQS